MTAQIINEYFQFKTLNWSLIEGFSLQTSLFSLAVKIRPDPSMWDSTRLSNPHLFGRWPGRKVPDEGAHQSTIGYTGINSVGHSDQNISLAHNAWIHAWDALKLVGQRVSMSARAERSQAANESITGHYCERTVCCLCPSPWSRCQRAQ